MYLLTHINKDNTFSITDDAQDKVIGHYSKEQLEQNKIPVVGIFRNEEGIILEAHKVNTKEEASVFDDIIAQIKTADVQAFAKACVRIIPSYIFKVYGSVSGSHHPICNIGDGGLVRHTYFVCTNLLHITSIESTQQLLQLNQRQIDLMVVACMMHDCVKDGWDLESGKVGYNLHPQNAAKAIRGMVGFLDTQSLEFIAHCIESHMGQWSEPKPSDKYQWLVHLADYLASREDITLIYKNTVYAENTNKVEVVQRQRDPLFKNPAISTKDLANITYAKQIANDEIIQQHSTKLGITRTSSEVRDIWDSLLKFKSASDKQIKYIELARIIANAQEV